MVPRSPGRVATLPVLGVILLAFTASGGQAQPASQSPTASGRITGSVTIAETGEPVHGAIVLVTELRRSSKTGWQGEFELPNLPAGTYALLAQREHLTTERRTVTVVAGETVTVDFALALSGHSEAITVTATVTGEATTFEAFNSVNSLDIAKLAQNMSTNIAEVLEPLPGIAKRSFGPGSSRPIIRGFDGDRVLVMQDGVRTGDLSSQSGDHGVSIDPAGLARLEVVKGPATLMYGSNALGGVVNAITPQELLRATPYEGFFRQATVDAGSANRQGGAAAGVQIGHNNWLFWAGGGARRSGDYDAPGGRIPNSHTRLANGNVGVGYAGSRAYVSLGAQVEDTRYGIPFAGLFHGAAHADEEEEEDHDEEDFAVDISGQRYDLRLDLGLKSLEGRYFEGMRVTVNGLAWRHDELEIEDQVETPGTQFKNDVLVVRAEATQKPVGRLSGRIGLSGQLRDYVATGPEALAPPTTLRSLAGFFFEELNFGRYRFQFGGRAERNAYRPGARPEGDTHEHEGEEHEPPPVRDRTFTGLSGSLGVHRNLGADSALVVNLTRSVRAPALEELYNFGPHIGNLSFEVGNSELEREASLGLDVSLRRRAGRVRGEVNGFVYAIDNFVYLSFTGEEADGLREAEYDQGDSRFMGMDGSATLELPGEVHLTLGAGYVSAKLTDLDEWLPRIPPFHGTVSLEVPWRRLHITPEVGWTAAQKRIFHTETETAGFATVNLNLRWERTGAHATHIVTLRGYNLTDETYRLHTSFIKDLAPEMGRGVKASYSLRFF
jgi:iron complex outermembrane recepter protein